jgi:hypothetical protein
MKKPAETTMISMPNPTRTAQTASRSLSVIGRIFGYSVSERKCSRGNTQSLLPARPRDSFSALVGIAPKAGGPEQWTSGYDVRCVKEVAE